MVFSAIEFGGYEHFGCRELNLPHIICCEQWKRTADAFNNQCERVFLFRFFAFH